MAIGSETDGETYCETSESQNNQLFRGVDPFECFCANPLFPRPQIGHRLESPPDRVLL
jgi:hypothetical protein